MKKILLLFGLIFLSSYALGENQHTLDLKFQAIEKIDLTKNLWWISPGVFLNNDQLQQDFSQEKAEPKAFLGPMPAVKTFLPSAPSIADEKNSLDRKSFFGTLFIKLSNVQAGEYSLLFIGSFAGSHQVSLVEGQQETFLFKAGDLSTDIKNQSLVTTSDHYNSFITHGKDIVLKVYYSVPELKRIYGTFYTIGFGGNILLYPKDRGNVKALIKRIEVYSILGFYLFFTIYSLSIFILRREDSVSFWIFISSLLLSLRYVNTERMLANLFEPNNFAVINSSTLGIIQTMAQHSTFILINKTLGGTNKQFRKVKVYLPLAYLVGLFQLVYLFPNWLEHNYARELGSVYYKSIFILSIVWGASIYAYYGLFFLTKKKRIAEEAFAFLACVCILFGCVTDFFISLKFIDLDFYFSSWSMAFAILFFSLSTGARFSSIFARSKELNIELDCKNKEVEAQKKKVELINEEVVYINKNLEIIVEAKTQDIRSMLDNIPQGILSIGQDLRIAKEHSAHLLGILARRDLEGLSIKNAIFEHSDLSLDMQDRAEQTLLASLGEDALAFELNESNLPRELVYCYDGCNKSLRITWNVELTSQNIVNKILVTLLDVSAERQLEKEVEKQKQDMQIIKQLVDCGAEKFSQFVANSSPLIEESARLISIGNPDESTIKILFVNMHTIKGGARTLGFKKMADILHEVEQYYSDIIRKKVEPENLRFETDISRSQAVFKNYIEINRVKLGRNDTYDKVSVDIHFLEDHYKFLGQISNLSKGVSQDELHRIVVLEKEHLADLIFKSLSVIIDDCLSQSKKIAQDLDKLNPLLDVNVEDFLVNRKTEQMLRNCMTHLIRNAMDHGIEKREERLQLGKNIQGTIFIRAKIIDNTYLLEFSDDGRGLAIDILRKKGELNGTLLPNANLSEIANMIFSSGLSTSKKVSQISGRGVGMEAVKKFIEDDGGSIQLELGEKMNSQGTYYQFKLVLRFNVNESNPAKIITDS